MKNSKIQVSIIIVNYKVEKELVNCVSSIINSKPKTSFEIILVDNGSEGDLKTVLKPIYAVKYIKSNGNIGFGAANNSGAKEAKGDYLFFLNPDTIVGKNSIDILFKFIKNNSKAGMVAPLLFNPSGKIYPNQGSDQYDFKSALVTSSFINKLFPNNPISGKFFHKDWAKKEIEEFDVVPGTAFMIRKSLFKEAQMFDEEFFLYFEEYDLAKRIKKLGYKSYIIPKAKIMHIWEASTKKRKDIGKIFSQSRRYFFRKNYGTVFSFVVELFSSIGKIELLLGLILILFLYLSSVRIRELMPFIGDQGWFYLSARDAILSGQIPLVGIASSHPWLHQGALWTYLLIPFLWLSSFDPVGGAYLTIILGLLSVFGIYLVGSTLFSKRTGLIAAFLYASSPLVVYYARFPYHTSPIPLFIIGLIFYLYKISQGRINYLPLVIFSLTILYNFEIATVVLWSGLIGILGYKFFKNKKYLIEKFNKKIVFFSFLSFFIPLLPMILYDMKNGFPQTLKFVAWIFYRSVSLVGQNQEQVFSINKIIIMFNFLFDNFRKLIFVQDGLISFLFLLVIICWVVYLILSKKSTLSHNLLFLLFLFPVIIVVINGVPSDAYLPMFFPIIILIVASFFDFIISKKSLVIPVFIITLILGIMNINSTLRNNFLFDKSGELFTLDKRIKIAHEILNISQDKDYNLEGLGIGSKYESFTMNYKYLTWWLGHAPSNQNQLLKIYVSESQNGIEIEKIND